MLNQSNELLKLNHEIYNKNNVTHFQEKSIKECSKRNDFQIASKTATKKVKLSFENHINNSKNNNRLVSHNRFGRFFYEYNINNNNDDNESVKSNSDSTKTLRIDQINKYNFARKYNNNNKNKNSGRPKVVINQSPENQTIYPSKGIVPRTFS